MIKLRKLNEKGLLMFGDFLKECYAQKFVQDIPVNLLQSSATSEVIDDVIELDEKKKFKNRYELGCYLTEKFEPVNMQAYLGDEGFWSALAIIWFDQLTILKKKTKEGKVITEHRIVEDVNYKYSKKFGRQQRHAIYTTWRLVSEHGEHVRFFMSNNLTMRGEFTELLMGTQKYINLKSVIEAADKIYRDEKSQTDWSWKVGATTRVSRGGRGGDIGRYIDWLKQININYDLYKISTDDLVGLLPSEFNRFLNN